MISTESVLTYYVRGCTADEDIAVKEFFDWLASREKAAYVQGRRDGALFGELK